MGAFIALKDTPKNAWIEALAGLADLSLEPFLTLVYFGLVSCLVIGMKLTHFPVQ